MSNVLFARVLHMADVITANIDFAHHISVDIAVLVSIVMNRQLSIAYLNAVHAAVLLLAHVVYVGRECVTSVFQTIIG